MNLPPHKLILTDSDWLACLEKLRPEPRIAIDLEANSMYAYREQVCLIQISIPGQDYIVDPLTIVDLSGLGEIIADPTIEKVFHAAEYDLTLIKRQYEWELNNLFDTMWAARILGYQRYGLASLLEQVYEVKLDKRFQKSDWCKRPLLPEQLIYAQLDTHYLLRLRDHLEKEMISTNRIQEATQIFKEQTRIKLNDNTFHPDSFWSIGGAHDLSRQEQALLKALHIFRNDQAERRNQPLFKIFNDKTMIELVHTAPRNQSELRRVHGMSHGQVRRYGKQLLDIIRKGKHLTPPAYPKRNKRPPEAVISRYDKLHQWRKVTAQARGVESDVIISREALWVIAKTNPQSLQTLEDIDLVGKWRCNIYGRDILNMLNSHSPNNSRHK
ncbi:MAG: ribonuclease D [Chloroflexi bacterium]|nr:ribonuclease D [Chloroflexota bacterium]